MNQNDSALRWAIIGTGTISHSIAEDLLLLGGQITAVHSRTLGHARSFAQTYEIPFATDDYESILATHVDIIYIATPFATHADFCRKAIAAGKHVLVEKPMAMNSADVKDLFNRAASANVFLMEAMWTKFTPGFIALLKELREGRIGEPRSLRASFGVPIPPGGSRWDPAGSPGTLLDQGIYPVSLAHAVFGAPARITATGTIREDGLDLAEHFTLEFADGRFAQGAASMIEFLDLSAAVSGTRGWIRVPEMFWRMSSLEIHADDPRKLFKKPEVIRHSSPGNGYVPMLAAVTHAVSQHWLEHPSHTAAETLAVFNTLDTIREQIRNDKPQGASNQRNSIPLRATGRRRQMTQHRS